MSISVYQIVNKVNGKSYIGITENPQKRWTGHKRCKTDFPIHLAIKKYGVEAFLFFVLEVIHTRREACEKEKYYIKLLTTKTPYGYNLTDGGDGVSGLKGRIPWNKGTKGVCKAWNKGIPCTEEARKNMSEAQTGRKQSEETKRKRGIYRKQEEHPLSGKPQSEEHRNNLSTSHIGLQNHKGYKHTEETKETIREKKTGQKYTKKTKDLMSESHTGMKHAEEAKANMRAAWAIRKQKY